LSLPIPDQSSSIATQEASTLRTIVVNTEPVATPALVDIVGDLLLDVPVIAGIAAAVVCCLICIVAIVIVVRCRRREPKQQPKTRTPQETISIAQPSFESFREEPSNMYVAIPPSTLGGRSADESNSSATISEQYTALPIDPNTKLQEKTVSQYFDMEMVHEKSGHNQF
jgi:hypothetical protein